MLSHAFESEVQADNLNFLDVSPDDERVKRYHMISSYLSRYDYLQPKVPDLDEIVPCLRQNYRNGTVKSLSSVGMKGKPA